MAEHEHHGPTEVKDVPWTDEGAFVRANDIAGKLFWMTFIGAVAFAAAVIIWIL